MILVWLLPLSLCPSRPFCSRLLPLQQRHQSLRLQQQQQQRRQLRILKALLFSLRLVKSECGKHLHLSRLLVLLPPSRVVLPLAPLA